MTTDRPPWFVFANDSGCGGKVQLSIFEASRVSDEAWEAHLGGESFDGADPKTELTLSGSNWRALLAAAATEMSQRLNLPICAQCVVAYVGDFDDPADPQRLEIANEAVGILSALQGAQTSRH
jgi:hypothetical protein